METRLPMLVLQKIFATCWFCIKLNFISLVNPPCEEAYSEPSQTSWLELSACIDNGMSSWIILIGSCTQDVWLGSEYASDTSETP